MAAVLHSTGSAALRTPQPIPTSPRGEFSAELHLAARAQLEAQVDALLDDIQSLIALLDTLDGDADLEPDDDGEPSLCRWGAFHDPCDDREIDAADYREVA